MSGVLHVATEGFATDDETGTTVRVRAGDIAEGGHWLLSRSPGSFRPFVVQFPTGESGGDADAKTAVADAQKALADANAAVVEATARIAALETERDELVALLEHTTAGGSTSADPAPKRAAKNAARR